MNRRAFTAAAAALTVPLAALPGRGRAQGGRADTRTGPCAWSCPSPRGAARTR